MHGVPVTIIPFVHGVPVTIIPYVHGVPVTIIPYVHGAHVIMRSSNKRNALALPSVRCGGSSREGNASKQWV